MINKNKLPLYATFFRIFVTPIILFLLLSYPLSKCGLLAAILFTLGGISDFLDGYWARKYQAISKMGKLFDPIADKVLVTSSLVMLLWLDLLGPIIVLIFIIRDVLVGGIRSMAASENLIIAADKTGKWKTTFQMVGITCLLLTQTELVSWFPCKTVGLIALYLSVALALVSGFNYLSSYLKKLN